MIELSTIFPGHLLSRQEGEEKPLARLIDAYQERGRYYHTFNHIQKVVETCRANVIEQKLDCSLESWDQLRLAAYYHDVVYLAGSKDNECNSCQIFKNHFDRSGAKLSGSAIVRIIDLIMATKTHVHDETDEIKSVLINADLAGLASSNEEYWQNNFLIWMEFKGAGYKAEDFNNGRIKWLATMLERLTIFKDSVVLEEKARTNMVKELIFRLNTR